MSNIFDHHGYQPDDDVSTLICFPNTKYDDLMSSSSTDDSPDTDEINTSVSTAEDLLTELAAGLPKPDDDWTNLDDQPHDYELYDFDDGFSVTSN